MKSGLKTIWVKIRYVYAQIFHNGGGMKSIKRLISFSTS